jgi:hypothetical protein
LSAAIAEGAAKQRLAESQRPRCFMSRSPDTMREARVLQLRRHCEARRRRAMQG